MNEINPTQTYQSQRNDAKLQWIPILYYNLGGWESPLARDFFRPSNIEYCKQEIDDGVNRLATLKEPYRFRCNIDQEFGMAMAQIAFDNQSVWSLPDALGTLNAVFINRRIREYYDGLVNRRLRQKYFLETNYLRYLPRPLYTRPIARTVTYDNGSYNLLHPWKRWQNDYLLVSCGLVTPEGSEKNKYGETTRWKSYYTPGGARCNYVRVDREMGNNQF